jgi:hypothetical protein
MIYMQLLFTKEVHEHMVIIIVIAEVLNLKMHGTSATMKVSIG